jgi:hypothetical protein
MSSSRAGTARGGASADTLSALVASGERLLLAAEQVGDQESFHAWRQKRNAWVRGVTYALAGEDVRGPAERFRAVARVERPLVGWRAALPGEVEAIRDAVGALERKLPPDKTVVLLNDPPHGAPQTVSGMIITG